MTISIYVLDNLFYDSELIYSEHNHVQWLIVRFLCSGVPCFSLSIEYQVLPDRCLLHYIIHAREVLFCSRSDALPMLDIGMVTLQ
jgi:hypothetical protein